MQTRQDASFAAVAKLETEVSAVIQKDPPCQAWSVLPVRPDTIRVKARRGCSSSSSRSENVTVSSTVIVRLKPQIAKLRDVKFFMQAGQDETVGGRLVQAQDQYTLPITMRRNLITGRQFCCASCGAWRSWRMLHRISRLPRRTCLTVDRDAAYRLGLSMGLIDQTLYDAFGQ